MKFLIVLACLLAIAYANEVADVIVSESEVNPESFKYAVELSNHIKALQEGHVADKDNWIVSGQFEYVSPEGKNVKVTYTADETGYHPVVHSQ